MDFGVFIPIVAIIMGCGIPIVAIWSKQKIRVAEMQVSATAKNTAERAAQYASEVQKLEDRVRVLERIVTDKGYDVATQIEALRDQRAVDGLGAGVPLDTKPRENV